MTRIIAYIRPHKLEQVKAAIAALEVGGLHVADVRGRGNSPETNTLRIANLSPLPVRSRIEVIVEDQQAEEIVETIIQNARTGDGEPGDGKIILEKVLDAIRIRTGESGDLAL